LKYIYLVTIVLQMKVLTILPVLIGALMLIVIGVSWLITPASAGTASRYNLDYTDADTVAAGKMLYTQHCAACHGKSLEGQKSWRSRLPNGRLPAPPHDASGHTWHHPDKQLFELTKFGPAAIVGGGYQSDMPGYQDILSDSDILAVLAFIKSTWPAQIRERHDQMNLRSMPR